MTTSLSDAWRPVAHRIAVAGGSLVALVALFQHVPVSIAAYRGGTAYLAVLLIGRFGLAALEQAAESDRADAQAQGATEESYE